MSFQASSFADRIFKPELRGPTTLRWATQRTQTTGRPKSGPEYSPLALHGSTINISAILYVGEVLSPGSINGFKRHLFRGLGVCNVRLLRSAHMVWLTRNDLGYLGVLRDDLGYRAEPGFAANQGQRVVVEESRIKLIGVNIFESPGTDMYC